MPEWAGPSLRVSSASFLSSLARGARSASEGPLPSILSRPREGARERRSIAIHSRPPARGSEGAKVQRPSADDCRLLCRRLRRLLWLQSCVGHLLWLQSCVGHLLQLLLHNRLLCLHHLHSATYVCLTN